jgi:hypothetical protein
MPVGDPVNRRGGLSLGLAFLSRRSLREISTENPNFEIASIYNATGMPKINFMILHEFHFLRILQCTIFCAVVHSFLCKKEGSGCFIGGATGFQEDFYVFGMDGDTHIIPVQPQNLK